MESQETMLAIDAALGPCSVAVVRGGTVLAFLEERGPQKQASLLVPMVQQVMEEAGVQWAALTQIFCIVGPGSFTGVRIGLATARGLGFASGVPVHGVSTLAAAAWKAGWDEPITVALPAGKGEHYAQTFHRGVASEVRITTLAALAGERLTTTPADARHAAALAQHAPALLLAPEPLYIRPPDAKPCG